MSKSGKLVRLHCQFDGQPCPSVTWYRNEAIINPSDRFKIKSEANTSTLEICNVGVNDSGIYTCRAVNEAGSASTTANIVVAGKQHPSSPDNPMPSALLAAGDKTSDIGMPFFIRLVWILWRSAASRTAVETRLDCTSGNARTTCQLAQLRSKVDHMSGHMIHIFVVPEPNEINRRLVESFQSKTWFPLHWVDTVDFSNSSFTFYLQID